MTIKEFCINCQDLNCIECDEAEDWQKFPNGEEEIACAGVEKIIASAVQLADGQIFVGKRHADAQKSAMAVTGKNNYPEEKIIREGFVTNQLRFVGREEGCIIAKNSGQFKRNQIRKTCGAENGYDGTELYSEDLW
jgi:hypothetical protein